MPRNNTYLSRPLDEKLLVAIQDMSDGKWPGMDGLSCNLYKKLWPVIGSDLLEMPQDSLKITMDKQVNAGMIKLVPKGSKSGMLGSWTGHTAQVCYKVIVTSKAPTNRIKSGA